MNPIRISFPKLEYFKQDISFDEQSFFVVKNTDQVQEIIVITKTKTTQTNKIKKQKQNKNNPGKNF